MSYVTKRADSNVYQFVYRTPSKVLAKLRGKSLLISFSYIADQNPFTIRPIVGEKVKFSLKTADKNVAQARELEALRQIEDYFGAANSNEAELSHRDLVRMSRAIYEAYLEIHQEEPGLPRQLAEHKALSRAISEGRIKSLHPLKMGEIDGTPAKELFGDDLTAGVNAFPEGEPDRDALETRFGELADYLLARYRIAVDDATRGRLLLQCAAASIDAGWRLKDNAAGDYGPDKRIERFGEPFISPSSGKAAGSAPAASKSSIKGILADWWKQARVDGVRESTHVNYKGTVESFVKFLGHDDASKLTPEDVVGYKDFRLKQINPRNGKTISARTVRDTDLAALKSIFNWAVGNRRMASNPVATVRVKVRKKKIGREKGFTDAEAKALLDAADALEPGKERPKTFAAKKWIPYLCAYSGARPGEMAQLRKQDLRKVGEYWVLRVAPDDEGDNPTSVKTDQYRDIVLHEHLVERGFPQFVKNSAPGYLFLNVEVGGDPWGKLQGVRNRLSEFAREVVTDMRVRPNYGWRHRFKTVARTIGMDGAVRDAIQGHTPRTVGDDYGDVTIEAMALALAKFPRQA
jgi:integrase